MGIYSKPVVFAVTATLVILAGTVVTVFVPMFMPSTQPREAYVKPYTAIEQEGRDLYMREGCNNCHTQTVRPLRTEVLRYGEYSKPEESAWDRPFLWGSRRTGPDLARLGGKYPDSWHYKHMQRPQDMFALSNMPHYAWMASNRLDTSNSFAKTRLLGFGYTEDEVKRQIADYKARVTAPDYDSKETRDQVTPEAMRGELTEMDAIIAYLQKLGRDVKEKAKEAGQ